MTRAQILDGLPPYGTPPQWFSRDSRGAHREGLIVEFSHSDAPPWLVHFQRGETDCDDVMPHLGAGGFMVVAGGHGYIVDPGKQELIETTVDDIDQLIVASPNLLILVRRYSIDARWPRGLLWSSDFFFVELRNVRVEDTRLLGEGRDPLNEWSKFVFDVANGKALAA